VGFAQLALSTDDESPSNSIARLKGHGSVSFQGDGIVSVDGDGALYVNENALVTVLGRYNFLEDEEDGRRVYIIEEGAIEKKVIVEGEDLELSYSGANIDLIATGTGELIAKGYGFFRVGFLFGIWTTDGTKIILGN
jgi:hypothetical protein